MRDLAPCCICGTSARTLRYRATPNTGERLGALSPYSGHYQINICAGCGLTYSSPIFDESDVHALYTNYSEANVAEEEIDNVRATMKGYYDLGRAFLPGKKRALDVGCDIGLLLDVMRQDGFEELHGLEPVEIARQKALERVSIATISGDFYQDTAFEKGSFDMITLIHVVDHLIRPNEILDRVLGDLRPGGICVAVVHDVESPVAKLTGERFSRIQLFPSLFLLKTNLARSICRAGLRNIACYAHPKSIFIGFFCRTHPGSAGRLAENAVEPPEKDGIGPHFVVPSCRKYRYRGPQAADGRER